MGNLRILLIGVASLILSGCATYSGNSMADPNDPWQAVNRPVFAVNDAFVFYNGICMQPTTDYGISGVTLTFTFTPLNSSNIMVRYQV